jgi:hypothetical protein
MKGNEEANLDLQTTIPQRKLVKPVTEIIIESSLARQMDTGPGNSGCFFFNDNTTQNWKVFQAYDLDTHIKYEPYVDIGNNFHGFTLANVNNMGLCACADNNFYIPTTKLKSYYIYLESPNLDSNPNWQAMSGYSVDVRRTLTAPCGDGPYYVQLQAAVVNTSGTSKARKIRTLAECDENNEFVFHPIKLHQNYHIRWKFEKAKTDAVVYVRIILVGLYNASPGQGECVLAKGRWCVANVCPEI